MIALGTEVGIVKLFNLKTQSIVKQWGQISKEREITQMCWGQDEKSIFVGMANGTIDWSTIDGSTIKSFSIGNSTSVTGLSVLPNNRLLATGEGGLIKVYNTESGDILSKFKLNRTITDMKFSHTVGVGCQKKDGTGGNDGRFLVCGGQNKLAQLIDLELKVPVWQSHNVPKDKLRMEVPIYDRAMDWIDEANTFVMVTMHSHVRIYDIREKRDPTINMYTDDMHIPFSSVSTNSQNRNLFCTGDQAGNFRYWDKRIIRQMGKTKGIVGSIKSIAFHPSKSFVACVGLDRYLHILNSHNRTYAAKPYIKLRMSKLIFSDFEISQEVVNENNVIEAPVTIEKPIKVKKAKKDNIDKMLGNLPVASDPIQNNHKKQINEVANKNKKIKIAKKSERESTTNTKKTKRNSDKHDNEHTKKFKQM